MTYNDMKNLLLYHRIVEWNGNCIKLDNGIELCIEETEQDCCACAEGVFKEVVLDAAITSVSDIKYQPWENDDTYGCSAEVVIMHNHNLICKAVADADAGNGGYYYSIASFVVKMPNGVNEQVHFVGSENDGGAFFEEDEEIDVTY